MARRTTYAAGGTAPWTVVVGDRAIVAFAERPTGARLDSVWSLARSGAAFETLVGVVSPLAGEADRVIVLGDIEQRGDAASFMALVAGPVGFDVAASGTPHHIGPTGSAPWLRTRVQNVSFLAIGADAASGVELPIERGVVTTARVSVDFAAVERPVASDGFVRPMPTGGIASELSIDAHDGQTIAGVGRDIPLLSGPVALPDLPDVPPTMRFGYRVNGGTAYAIDLPHRFGRNPRTSTPERVRVVPLSSSTKTVSAVHLDLRQVGDVVVASDLRSTNGTSVLIPGGSWRRLASGESAVVPAGTFIDVGDGNVIEIMPGVPL